MERFIFIYSAGSGIIENIPGTLAKAVGGKSACALCTITHGPVFPKTAWKRFLESLTVPVTLYHRNEIPRAIQAYLDSSHTMLPAVLKEGRDHSLDLFLSKEDLEACEGSVACLKKYFISFVKDVEQKTH